MLLSTIVSSMLYSLINLDATAIAQTMISRPMVISPIIGCVLGLLDGDVVYGAMIGITIGVLLEFFWINLLPLGSSVPPNATLGSAVATAIVCYLSRGEQIIVGGTLCGYPVEPYVTTIGLAYGVCCGYVGGRTDTALRALNTRLVRKAVPFVERGDPGVIRRLNLQAVGLSLGINSLLCAGLILTGIILLPAMIRFFPQEILSALKVSLYLFLLVCMGIALEAFMTRKTIFYFAAVWVVAAVIMAG